MLWHTGPQSFWQVPPSQCQTLWKCRGRTATKKKSKKTRHYETSLKTTNALGALGKSECFSGIQPLQGLECLQKCWISPSCNFWYFQRAAWPVESHCCPDSNHQVLLHLPCGQNWLGPLHRSWTCSLWSRCFPRWRRTALWPQCPRSDSETPSKRLPGPRCQWQSSLCGSSHCLSADSEISSD